MVVSFLWIISMCVLTGFLGFFWGRRGMEETAQKRERGDDGTGPKPAQNQEDDGEPHPTEKREEKRGRRSDRERGESERHFGRHRQREEKFCDRPVGSPAPGRVLEVREEPPEVRIAPFEDKLYAPAAGKIINILPMGNEITFQTEFGVELQIGVEVPEDELLGRLFRPRVVKNEVVVKGKPLLEFDPEGLREEGISPYVFVGVREIRFGSSTCVTAEGVLKTGEEIMVIKEPEASGQRPPGQVL